MNPYPHAPAREADRLQTCVRHDVDGVVRDLNKAASALAAVPGLLEILTRLDAAGDIDATESLGALVSSLVNLEETVETSATEIGPRNLANRD